MAKRYRNQEELAAILIAPPDTEELWTVLRDDVDIKVIRAEQLVVDEITHMTTLQLIVALNGYDAAGSLTGAADYLDDSTVRHLIRREINYRNATGDPW